MIKSQTEKSDTYKRGIHKHNRFSIRSYVNQKTERWIFKVLEKKLKKKQQNF